MELNEIRNKIDETDAALVELFRTRMQPVSYTHLFPAKERRLWTSALAWDHRAGTCKDAEAHQGPVPEAHES